MTQEKFRNTPRYSHRRAPGDIEDRLRGRHWHLLCYMRDLLPLREDYMPGGGAMPTAIHDTARDQGRYINTDGSGRVEMKADFIDWLDERPISWREFEAAIQEVEKYDRTSPSGAVMVRVLRFFQNRRYHAARGYLPEHLAEELGYGSPRSLARVLSICVDHVSDLVLRNRGS